MTSDSIKEKDKIKEKVWNELVRRKIGTPNTSLAIDLTIQELQKEFDILKHEKTIEKIHQKMQPLFNEAKNQELEDKLKEKDKEIERWKPLKRLY